MVLSQKVNLPNSAEILNGRPHRKALQYSRHINRYMNSADIFNRNLDNDDEKDFNKYVMHTY